VSPALRKMVEVTAALRAFRQSDDLKGSAAKAL
jgi:hypothetical protein